MVTQLKALVLAAVLAVSPMLLHPAAAVDRTAAPIVTASTPMPAAAQMPAQWAIGHFGDNCDANCQGNWSGVTIVYCGLLALANGVAGFACAVVAWG